GGSATQETWIDAGVVACSSGEMTYENWPVTNDICHFSLVNSHMSSVGGKLEPDMTPVISPMVGKILNIQVKAGDKVNEDETVMVMEAMKMEIPIVAPVTGTIKEIKVAVGDMVESEAIVALMD